MQILLFCATCAFGQTPIIRIVTNAALPALDAPDQVALTPRSMGSIFGSNLANEVASTTPPWKKLLGGVEVHLAKDSCIDASCDLAADLTYVSPTQINFVVPDVVPGTTSAANAWRIIIIRDGVRFDNRIGILSLKDAGRIYIAPSPERAYTVFGVGYECLYSYSLDDPGSCGLSWSPGQHRELLAAATDAASGQLLTTKNPARQGQFITLWATGLYKLSRGADGLLTGPQFGGVGFGVAQKGKDVPGTILPSSEGVALPFQSPPPVWAGESAQYVGLDQINVAFPTCTKGARATAEKRYDAFLVFYNMHTGTLAHVYLPFVVSPGDVDCDWSAK
jgi:hypothetical protein